MKAFLLYIKNFLDQIFIFLRGVYSDDGVPSSSRILTTFLAVVSSAILWKVFDHIVHISDIGIISAWLGNLPLIISALVLFFTAPYGVNRGSGAITDILNIFKGNKQP